MGSGLEESFCPILGFAWPQTVGNPGTFEFCVTSVSGWRATGAEVEGMSSEQIIAAFVVSTVGLSLFLFGKKQRRLPQFIVGILMMASPMVVPDPVWVGVSFVALLIGMRVAIRYDC